MSVAENLKAARIAKNLTQEEVGNLLGVAKQTIQKYEKGVVTNIPVERIQALADIYDVSPIDLMDWQEEEPKDANEELKFAFFGGADGITDEMVAEVKQFAEMVKDREAKKRNNK